MRLMILHQAEVFGGAERTTSNLLTHLDRSVVQHVTLVAPAALRDLLPAAYDAYIDTGPLIRGGWFTTPESLDPDIDAAAQLLRDVEADIALGMMHYSACLVALGADRAGLDTRAVGSFRGPTSEHIRRYERGADRIAFLHRVVRQTTAVADCILVPSQGTADDTCKHFQGSVERTIVIPNGIDTAAVRAAAAVPAEGLERLPVGMPLLCTAARLSIEKNLDLLISALGRVQATVPCALVIVGDGPERRRLEQQAADQGLGERVIFVGHQANAFPFIRAADIYVHTCHFEGFGYAMLEAMACGTPVIATDCPYGPREVLANGASGVLVPPADASALAAAMIDLVLDADRRALLKTCGLERSEELSIARMVRGYQSVFARLVNTGGLT